MYVVNNKGGTYYYLFLHTLCLAVCIIIWRKLLKEYNNSPTVVAIWSLGSGSFVIFLAYIFLPVWLGKDQDVSNNFEALKHLIGVWFMVTIAYSCNYAILAWATFKSSISVVAIYASARPVLTTILSLLNAESDSSLDIILSSIFLVMVLFGLLVISYGKKVERYKKTLKEEEKATPARRLTFKNATKIVEVVSDKPLSYVKVGS